MCSTCNYKNYEQVIENNHPILKQHLGNGDLQIICGVNGKGYKIRVKDDAKSEFVLYSCPTCGKKLY